MDSALMDKSFAALFLSVNYMKRATQLIITLYNILPQILSKVDVSLKYYLKYKFF